MLTLRIGFVLATCFLMGLGYTPSSAQAQGTAPAPSTTQTVDGWQFYVTPYLWVAGVNLSINPARSHLPTADVSVDFSQLISHLDGVPFMGAAEAWNGRFGMMFDLISMPLGSGFSTPHSLFNGGDMSLRMTTGTALGMFRAIDAPNQYLDIGGGVRPWGLSTDVALKAGIEPRRQASGWLSWADPLIAARYHVGLGGPFSLTVYGDLGGFSVGSKFTWQVLGTVDYAVTEWCMLSVGYRSLNVDYRGSQGALADLAMNGPFLAGRFRF